MMSWSPPMVHGVWFLSDLHGVSPLNYLPLHLPAEVPAVVFVGDLLEGFTTSQTTEDAWQALVAANPGRIFFVQGNHDCDFRSREWWTPERDLTGRIVSVDQVWIVGLGWTGTRPYQSPPPADQDRLCRVLDPHLQGRPVGVDVVVASHYAPNLNPWRRNSSEFAERIPFSPYEDEVLGRWIPSWKPTAVVFGHVHEHFGCQASAAGMTFVSSVVPAAAPLRRNR